jgi:PDZ domain
MRTTIMRWTLATLFTLGIVYSAPVAAQQPPTVKPARAKTILPGLHITSPTDLLRAHLPQLPAAQGLVVESVSADAPGGLTSLRRHDILLQFDGQPLKSTEDLRRFMAAGKPDRKVSMVILRGGQEMTVEITLSPPDLALDGLRNAIKPGGPPAVNVECTYLTSAKMQMVVTYYAELSSQLQTLTCTGSLMEIEQQVREHQLPDRVEDLVDVAIKKLRMAAPK